MDLKKLLIGSFAFTVIAFSIVTVNATGILGTKDEKIIESDNKKYDVDKQTGVLKYNNFDLNNLEQITNNEPVEQTATIKGNVQEITTNLNAFGYPALIVQKGIPVKWTIIADEQNLNSCNNEIVIPELNISKKLELGENTFEFTIEDSGIVPYSCWMGMLNSTIAVVDDINNIGYKDIQNQINALPAMGGCCGSP